MGDDQYISKKDVLEAMGISYGQLYRWKRKGLIPETWFIRRSTFTGQETFFPREKIVARIQRIKDMKDEHALDDLAEVITERVNVKLQVAFDKLKDLGWFDEQLMETCCERAVAEHTLSIRDAFCMASLKRMSRAARPEEVDLLSRTLNDALSKKRLDLTALEGKHLFLMRKQLSGVGISAEISVVAIGTEDLVLDPETVRVDSMDLAAMLQQVKLDLARQGVEAPETEPTAGAEGKKEDA